MTERHERHKETLSNGCRIEVKAEIERDGSLKMFIGVYGPDGSVIEADEHPSPPGKDMEDAMEWAIEKAKAIGNSQHTL